MRIVEDDDDDVDDELDSKKKTGSHDFCFVKTC